MKWFMCCNEQALRPYWDCIRVALATAWRARHDLQPHLVYDGADRPELDWLRERGVEIIRHRVTFEQQLRAFYQDRAEVAMGCFLRTEIPLLCDDEFVLYTDCDVMFTGRDVRPIQSRRPPLLCAAPEFGRNDWRYFNGGVMILNLPGLRKELPRLPSCFQNTNYDQTCLLALCGQRWSRLSPEYNHKPYWGVSRAARIVHFHGPKPTWQPPPTANEVIIASLRRGGFDHYAAEWKKIRDAVEDGTWSMASPAVNQDPLSPELRQAIETSW